MKLNERLYIVAGGNFGFNLTHSCDCYVYLIDCRDELVLIDAGVGLEQSRILDNIRYHGFDPQKISSIFITHGHCDHVGGCAAFRAFTGCTIYALPGCDEVIRLGKPEGMSLDRAQRVGLYPPYCPTFPCEVETIHDNQVFTFGDVTLTAIHTAGHAVGSASYLLNLPLPGQDTPFTGLFVGDQLVWGGTISLQGLWDTDIQAYIDCLERYSSLEFDAFLPGHLNFSLTRGKRHIENAKRMMDTMVMPKHKIDA